MLEVERLCVSGKGRVPLLENVSFKIELGGCIGLTGASGAGKTTLIKSIMGVLDNTCRIESGNIAVDGNSLTSMPARKHRDLCGTTLGFIPQNPMTAFDRHYRIGSQMVETFRLRLRISKNAAVKLAKDTLEQVNLLDTRRIMDSYPAQLSGGMLQRITMAILWAMKPKYILADEPTSALDEANRDILLDLLCHYPETKGVLLISHDIVALKSICERIMVMEKGHLIEEAATGDLFQTPINEWTKRFVTSAKIQGGGKWQWKTLK